MRATLRQRAMACTDQQEIVDEFLQKVEGILNDDTSLKRLPKIEKEMADLHRRKEKLLDLRLDNNIDRDIYEKKNQELSEQLKKLQEEQERLMELSRNQDNTRTRLREFRKVLGSGEILESFDRVVFESVVEKIVIGGYNNEGVEEPLKITFEYKTGIHSNFNGKDFKPKRKNAAAVHNDAELCSYTSDEAEKLCLHSSSDTFRTVVPFHHIAPCLMVSGQLHQAEVGETVSVHVNQPDFQVILSPSIFFSFNLNALLVSGYICHSIHTVLHIPRFPYLQYISRPGKPVPVQLHFPNI